MPMEHAAFPIRHSSSMPLMVHLPRRYDVYDEPIPRRRSSLQADEGKPNPAMIELRRASLQLDGISNDEDLRQLNLVQAMQWLKQQLIFLRQHDLLLRRQFLEIKASLAEFSGRQHTDSCSSEKTSSGVSEEGTDIDEDEDDEAKLEMFMFRSASSYTTLPNSSDSDDSEEFSFRSCTSVTSLEFTTDTRQSGSCKDYLV